MSSSALRLRAVRAVSNYFRRRLDAVALVNLDDVEPCIRRHLTLFYAILLCATASSALGSYSSSTVNIGDSFSALGAFMPIVYFYDADLDKLIRIFLLIFGAFYGGLAFAPWFTWFFNVDKGFVVTSISAISVGFGCFWAASKWTNRFKLVYFRALLLYSPLVFICLVITSAVIGGDLANWIFQLYVLLLCYMVYVVVYSQEVVDKARMDDRDYLKHAVILFTDFPAVVINAVKLMNELRIRRSNR